MPAQLIVSPANAKSYEVTLGQSFTIGRADTNDLALTQNPHVSRNHAAIRAISSFQFQIFDLGSRNGTFLNGKRLVLPATLNHGDVIRIDDCQISFLYEDDLTLSRSIEHTIEVSLPEDSSQIQSIAVLVCDIRGFSAMSESISQDVLSHTLGRWFGEASEVIHSHDGIVDKFIGDAILAYWPNHDSRPVDSALKAAYQLLELANLHTWPNKETPIEIAIALHFGPVAFSNIGVVAQRDATLIGDAVNTVFRMEAISKQLNQKMIISDAVYSQLAEKSADFVPLGEHLLRGKTKSIPLYGF